VKVVVQHLKRQHFLSRRGEWTVSSRAKVFDNALEALRFCIERKIREVRLVANDRCGAEMYVYPFGGDPAVKARRKMVKRAVREARWFKRVNRVRESQ
jgi:hypothetical protein